MGQVERVIKLSPCLHPARDLIPVPPEIWVEFPPIFWEVPLDLATVVVAISNRGPLGPGACTAMGPWRYPYSAQPPKPLVHPSPWTVSLASQPVDHVVG